MKYIIVFLFTFAVASVQATEKEPVTYWSQKVLYNPLWAIEALGQMGWYSVTLYDLDEDGEYDYKVCVQMSTPPRNDWRVVYSGPMLVIGNSNNLPGDLNLDGNEDFCTTTTDISSDFLYKNDLGVTCAHSWYDCGTGTVTIEIIDQPENTSDIYESEPISFIAPNPTQTDYINVSLDETAGDFSDIKIYDNTGTEMPVLIMNKVNNFVQLSVKSYSNGIYFVKINTKHNVINNQFIIKR